MQAPQIYTNSFHPDLNDDADVKAHDILLSSGSLGLMVPGGTVIRQVDFAPGYECAMHRTQSLDFGIVTEGSAIMILDDGSETLMKRGDVAVQRATMHAWRNASSTEWCRMTFVLQDIKPLVVAGKEMEEDMSRGRGEVAAGGSDK